MIFSFTLDEEEEELAVEEEEELAVEEEEELDVDVVVDVTFNVDGLLTSLRVGVVFTSDVEVVFFDFDLSVDGVLLGDDLPLFFVVLFIGYGDDAKTENLFISRF